VLRDADVTAKFEKTIKGVFCPEFARSQHRVTLKRLFALVLFLDRAKKADVLQLGGVSCLFDPKAAIKASEDVLKCIARELLSGEGDIVR
jgi:hypothetical protein